MYNKILGIRKIVNQSGIIRGNKCIKKKRISIQGEREKMEKKFENMIEIIKKSEVELARGEGRDAEEVFEEWENKYGY